MRKADDRLPECYRKTGMSLAEEQIRWEIYKDLHREQKERALVAWILAEIWHTQATKEYKKGNRKQAKELRSKANAKAKEAQAILDDKRPLSFLKDGR